MNQLMTRPQNQVQIPIKDQIAGAMEYASFLYKAGMAPSCFKSAEALAVTMMRGAELGFTYSESVTSLYVVNNAVAPYTKTLVYMFEQHGGKVELLEWDDAHAKIRLSQRGRAPLVVQFTLAECKAAGWNMQGGSEKETWKKMPRIMVLNRTVTNGIRAYSPTSQFVRTFDPDMADQVDEDIEADDSIEGMVTELMAGAPVTEAEIADARAATNSEQDIQKPTPNAGFKTWPIPKQNRFTKFMGDHGLSVAATCEELDVKTLNDWQYSSGQTAPILDALSYPDEIPLSDVKAALHINSLGQIVWYGFTSQEIKEAINAYISDAKVTEPTIEGEHHEADNGQLL